jgi:hypothetical protein
VPLSEKPKTCTKMKKMYKKTWRPGFLEYAERNVYRLSKKKQFLRVFLDFLTKECSILAALKQMILD